MTDDELAAELAELLGDPDPAEPTTEDEIRLAITRGMRRLSALFERSLQVTVIASAEIARISRWQSARRDPIQAASTAMQDRLEMLHAMLLEVDPKALTVDTPAGVHGSRKASEPTIAWVDEAAFVEWARERGRSDLVRESFAPDKAAVKKALRCANEGVVVDPATGEVVDGLAVQDPVRTFHTRLASRDDR